MLRRADQGQLHPSGPQRLQGLGRGMVGDPQPDSGIGPVEPPQHRQKHGVQRRLRGADGDEPALQAPSAQQLPLPCFQVRLRRLDMVEKPLSLSGQRHAPVGPEKECRSQLLLQILNGPGHVGLVAVEGLRRVGQAPRLGHGIKYPV